MTTITGKLTSCGPTEYFSLTYTCTGPNCSNLNGFPNTTCTTDGTTLSCTNGVTCGETGSYTSEFSYKQDKVVVANIHTVDMGDCGSFVVNSDGTTGGTTSSVTDAGSCMAGPPSNSTSILPSGTPLPSTNGTGSPYVSPSPSAPIPFTGGASARHPSRAAAFCFFLLTFTLFIQGTFALTPLNAYLEVRSIEATENEVAEIQPVSMELVTRATPAEELEVFKEFANLVAEYVGGKIDSATKPDPENKGLFAKNLVAEIENAICQHYAGKLINAALGADLVEACVTAVLAAAVVDPPLELLAVFGAGTLCNVAVAKLFPIIPEVTDKLVEAFCSEPKPCGDLLNDPKNCGACGNVVCYTPFYFTHSIILRC